MFVPARKFKVRKIGFEKCSKRVIDFGRNGDYEFIHSVSVDYLRAKSFRCLWRNGVGRLAPCELCVCVCFRLRCVAFRGDGVVSHIRNAINQFKRNQFET